MSSPPPSKRKLEEKDCTVETKPTLRIICRKKDRNLTAAQQFRQQRKKDVLIIAHAKLQVGISLQYCSRDKI